MPARSTRPFGPSHEDWSPQPDLLMRLLVVNPKVLDIAALLPPKPPGTCGRPRQNPEALTALAWCAKGAFKSLRGAATWFRDEVNWTWLRQTWKDLYDLDLNDYPPARKTLELQLKRMRPLVQQIATTMSDLALQEAQRQGRFSGIEKTMGVPPRRNLLIGDGTVPKPRLKPKTIRRLQANGVPRNRLGRRVSVPEVDRHVEGGGHKVQGLKFVIMTSRPDVEDDDTNLRLVLGIRPCRSGDGGEAAVAVELATELRGKCSQVQGLRYDGAMHGANLTPLMRAGLSVISNPGDTDAMKARPFEKVKCDCDERVHDLYTEAGWLCVATVLDTGELHLDRLPDRKVKFVQNKAGNQDYRCFLTVTLPCGRRHTTRLDTTAEDTNRGLNRAERLRQFPPGTPEYDDTYRWRNDVESHNNNLDSTHYRGRMIADDPVDQYLVVLSHGFVRNVLAEAVYDDRQTNQRAALQAA